MLQALGIGGKDRSQSNPHVSQANQMQYLSQITGSLQAGHLAEPQAITSTAPIKRSHSNNAVQLIQNPNLVVPAE